MALGDIRFYFEYAGPRAYPANKTLPRRLPDERVQHAHVCLRGFDSFLQGVPCGPAKLRYLMREAQRCAEHEGVALQRPAIFPINRICAGCGMPVAEEEGAFVGRHERMFSAAWAERRNISAKEEVVAVAAEGGLDRDRFAADPDSAGIKSRFRENTESAKSRGVFGEQSFIVSDEFFWGHDRMGHIARALAESAAGAN